jgi:hypothetical protein
MDRKQLNSPRAKRKYFVFHDKYFEKLIIYLRLVDPIFGCGLLLALNKL